MKRYIPILLIVFALLPACEREIDIAETGNQMVLNGVPADGKRAFINFAYTRFFLDGSNDHPVNGAKLTLYVNGVPYLPDSMSHCNYFFPYTLVEGDSLAIDITTPNGPVSAQTYVPLQPDVASFKYQTFASSSFNFLLATFTLNDHAANDEIYSITITQRDSGLRRNDWTASIDTVDTVHNTYFIVQDQALTADDVCPYIPLGGYLYSNLMFLDRHIDGQAHPVALYIIQTVDTNEVRPFLHEYTVNVASVTPARFRYILSASSQNSMTSFFAEQGEVFSNVQGALGIFAGQSSRRYVYDTLLPVEE